MKIFRFIASFAIAFVLLINFVTRRVMRSEGIHPKTKNRIVCLWLYT